MIQKESFYRARAQLKVILSNLFQVLSLMEATALPVSKFLHSTNSLSIYIAYLADQSGPRY